MQWERYCYRWLEKLCALSFEPGEERLARQRLAALKLLGQLLEEGRLSRARDFMEFVEGYFEFEADEPETE